MANTSKFQIHCIITAISDNIICEHFFRNMSLLSHRFSFKDKIDFYFLIRCSLPFRTLAIGKRNIMRCVVAFEMSATNLSALKKLCCCWLFQFGRLHVCFPFVWFFRLVLSFGFFSYSFSHSMNAVSIRFDWSVTATKKMVCFNHFKLEIIQIENKQNVGNKK